MKNMAYFDTTQYGWQRMLSVFAALAAFVVIAFAMTGCSDDDTSLPPAPGQPTNFTVTRPGDALLTAELLWQVPSTGGKPASYEIYRSTTAGTVFQDGDHIFSVPAVDGETIYSYIDNVGLTNNDTYWVVAAKNARTETPTAEVMFRPIGPPGGVGDTGYGNNFAAALIFADDIGISGLDLGVSTGWTTDLMAIDVNTGLRPSDAEVTNLLALTVPVTTLPNLDPATEFILNSVTYYKQQTVSTWQGQWVNGAATEQHVAAKWGDNLISQKLTANSTIRIEMVLSKALTTPMTSYLMQSLYGSRVDEMVGTDGTTYDNLSAFVFASNARLKIQKLDATGADDGAPLFNQTLWNGDGPGFLAGEINVAGNYTYGFVWNLKSQTLPGDITTGKSGTWRITFLLDPDNTGAGKTVPLASNNTFIDTATNGVRVSDTEAYIDIEVQ